MTIKSGHHIFTYWPLGRFSLKVVMSVCLCNCLSVPSAAEGNLGTSRSKGRPILKTILYIILLLTNVYEKLNLLFQYNLIYQNYFVAKSDGRKLTLRLFLQLMYTRRYGRLRGPTSSSCGGFWPSTEAFFALRSKKGLLCCYRKYYAIFSVQQYPQ